MDGGLVTVRAPNRLFGALEGLCAAAAAIVLMALGAGQAAAQAPAAPPVASEVRVAGDENQTRFILDLDRKIDVRAFVLADPYRVVLDIPQVSFRLPARVGEASRGLVKAFRYGLVMPGGSRIVMDLMRPAKIDKVTVLDPVDGGPAKLVVELTRVERAAFMRLLNPENRVEVRQKPADAPAAPTSTTDSAEDRRPLIVIDAGHGGVDTGTQAASGELEKTIVLDFARALRERIEKGGKFRAAMTRDDDTFIPLGERVQIARNRKAALFVSIHADALPRSEGDAQGATIYTLSDTASDAEAARLAESENRADIIGGVNLTEEPAEVADILIDLAQRETKTFSNRFARILVSEMKQVARLHRHPLKSAGFRVLKAPDVPSVLIELGYVSSRSDLQHLVSDSWRSKTVEAVTSAIDAFFARRVVSAGDAK